ncbi:unnamed protein product, partial [Fusarium graminearum]
FNLNASLARLKEPDPGIRLEIIYAARRRSYAKREFRDGRIDN